MDSPTYLAYLQTIVGNDTAIEHEKARLDAVIQKSSLRIKAGISPQSVPSLIWHLAVKEITRMQQLVGIPDSEMPGQARFLRAIAAATAFDTGEAREDPGTDALLEGCESLWRTLFFREMMDDLKRGESTSRDADKRRIAALMSLLHAVQLESAYFDQAEERIRTLFGPFSKDIIEAQLGLGVDEIIAGFKYVREEVQRRLNRVHDLTRPLYVEWNAFRELPEEAAWQYLQEQKRPDPRRETVARSFMEGMKLLNRFLIVTIDDVRAELGPRASTFLSAFSFVPGTVNHDFVTPFDTDAVRARPFAKLPGGEFLLFDFYYASFAPLYRLPECFVDAKHTQRLLRHRDKALEDDAVKLFTPVVDPSLQLVRYYVPLAKDNALAERDLLFLRNGTLILVESKAKPLRSIAAHRGNVRKIESDIKASIQAAYDQARSVWAYIANSTADAVFFDSDKPNRKEILRLNRNDVREVHIVVFLDSYCGFIGTDLAPWLNPDAEIGFPWVVDRNTLETIALKIDTFDKLTSFLGWRRQLHGSVFTEDEAVIAGYFVQHGPAPFPREASMVQLNNSYTDVFEVEYFNRKGIPVKTPSAGFSEPVFVSMRREGNRLIQEMQGKTLAEIDLFGGDATGKARIADSTLPRSLQCRPPAKPTRKHVGRNAPCPCGSGLKFKRCCLRQSDSQ